jgi:uncharacterized circularly permuted ATP-grasp superfamily protein/uncharacterized alpha-E superfamily protein
VSLSTSSVPLDDSADLGWLQRMPPRDPASHDELRDAQGRVREPWQRFFELARADATELDRRAGLIAQQIHDDGVTHNVYGADGSSPRPWSLELLPLLIQPADWAAIERGVVQRAALLNAMMADAYGAQRLLHEGLLPPALLFRHPGYLRPLHGVVPAEGLFLHIAAFDLARGPDGAWSVLSQRTQGPSGLGYVLHNRLIVSRLFPDAFRELRVQHIASSYRRLLDTVESLAREAGRNGTARVALLTPGPYNETYFEHAYLARYLGLPLVEGGDLTVRDDRLFLKTVEGLEPVHGLLRRLDDDYCDPLELRPDSTLGVPGLLQAVRAGNVVMANALGSGFLESPGVQGFLPAISERLLGEPLAMPTLPSWWCGEQAAWEAVRGQLDGKVLRSTFPRGVGRAADDPRASMERDVRRARIAADPEAWTVQSELRMSQAPLWSDGACRPRPAMLRVYVIADGQGRWHALPGGMTRVATRLSSNVSMQQGGSSLDTWVMTDGPVDTFSMLREHLRVDDIAARRRPVASRTAENLFWLGRYTERSEQLVRLAKATLSLTDADSDAPEPVLDALSALAQRTGLAPQGVPSLTQSGHVFERAVLAALHDGQGAYSIAFNLQALSRTAGALRERLSPEHWRLIRALAEDFEQPFRAAGDGLPSIAQVMPALDRLGVQLAAITGAQTDRMTRDHGWRLLTVGRLLERLISVVGHLRSLLDGGALGSAAGIDLLLELFDSTITFRARYQRHEDLLGLTDLLVLDEANPRAFACVLRRLRTEVGKLPGERGSIDALLALLPLEGAGITLDDIREMDDEQLRERLLVLADRLAEGAARLSDEIGQRYFAHAEGDGRVQRV